MNAAELTRAVEILAACDHHDESLRAARNIPDTIDLVQILRASDGAIQLAHAVDIERRIRT